MRYSDSEGNSAKRKASAILLAMLFIASAGVGLIAKYASEISTESPKSSTSALGVMDPGGIPHYFGPYANFANSPVPKGPVAVIEVSTGGSGYTAPVVSITDAWGTGSGASASAIVSGGVITAINFVSHGTGYSAPQVTIIDPTGTGASALAILGTLSGGIRKFVDSLPGLGSANANNLGNYLPLAIPDLTTYPGCDYYEIAVVKFTQKVHTDLPATTFLGYVQLETPAIASYSKHIALTNPDATVIRLADGSQAIAVDNPRYLGPTIVASRDIPTRVTFRNLLPTGAEGNLFLPVDTTYMGAGMGPLDMIGMPGMKENYTENRATLHLHGGATPWISDGTPHQWTTPANEVTQYPKGVSVSYVPDMWFVNGSVVPNTVGVTDPPVLGATTNPGPGSLTFYYTNQQSARLMFYHDHAYGITRLNVYAGEAAGYLLTDALENELVNSGVLPSQAGEYLYGIPLVIQDKTFVDASTIAYQDPTWAWGTTAFTPHTGDLWMPHVYMPNQNPYDLSGANPVGRWDYAPWFFPPGNILHGPVANPYYDPVNAPWEPPMIPGVPKVSAGMEAYMDTPIVNGQAYPYLQVEPQAYRFRILNAANDRFFNLQMYIADPNVVTSDGRRNTEVNMVPALSTPGFPPLWPSDGRAGGVPNPAYTGPSWVQIGTEGGFLPAPAEIPNQPVTWNYNPKTFNYGNVQDHSLLLGTAERADVIVDFSAYAGKTIILYNDAPAAFPALDPRSDYYTGDPDNTGSGGAPTTQAGYGPNTHTIMQIRVANHTPAAAYDVNALKARWASTSTHPGVFESSQDPILVPTDRYNSAYNASFPVDQYVRIGDTSMTFSTITGSVLTLPLAPKAIHDEMGGTYDTDYGRMMGSLGLEVPSGNAVTQMFIALPFASPPVEIMTDSVIVAGPILGDGTQLWKITHNGVDTHTMHWHMFNVQLVNRVAWDNTMLLPDDNELGWKETVRIDPLCDSIIAMRPVAMNLPWEIPNAIREIDPTMPDGDPLITPPAGFIDPNSNPVTINNHLVNFGWEYMLHCHLLEHEEMDMMHALVFVKAPVAPTNLTGTIVVTNATLTWIDRSISETGFRVQRSDNFGPWVTVATMNTPLNLITPTKGAVQNYNETVVADGTVYSYRVMSINTVGDTFDYGAGAGFPTSTANSTPSNVIDVDSGSGIVTVHSLPPPSGGGTTPPGAPAPVLYRSPLPMQVVSPSASSTYTPHATIRIDSNADFTGANGVTGGSGTSGSPWIIENLMISGADKSYCIYIGNTTDHFIVRNNNLVGAAGVTFDWLYSPDSAVVLNNVINGAVAYNTISSNAWAGVYLQGTQLVTVFNNTLTSNYMGIYLKSSSNNSIASNNISGSYSALWLDASNLNLINGNTITHNQPGIVLTGSNGNTVTNNSLYLNSYFGLWLHASGYNYIHDNDFVANHGATATRVAGHVQATDDSSTNRWNTSSRGNHWSDWTSPDANADGIVDVPYPIDGMASATDHYPLAAPIKPDILSTIVVMPSPIDVVLKSTQAFSAQGLNQYGVAMTGLTFTWSSNLGVMTGNALTAQAAAGTVGYVRAMSGAVSGDAIVKVVVGPLSLINVTPAAVSVIGGGYQLFTAQGMDAFYNNVTGLTYNWSTNVGAVTSFGLLTAQTTAGVTGFVSATVGAITGNASVTIVAGISVVNHIIVTPGNANVTAGSLQSFTAVAYDQFNQAVTGVAFTWSTNIGTMIGSNLTAMTSAGAMGYVSASSNMVVGTAFVTIVPAALDHIVVFPANVSVAASSQSQFFATGHDVYGNAISGLVFAWTTTVGTINSAGLFTAQAVAWVTGYVNASNGGKIGSATVHIIAVQSLRILVSPTPIAVVAGSNETFSAVAYDELNAIVPGVTFNWSTTIGTMTSNVLTAQTVSGMSGFVIASNGTSYGTAVVTVVPGALHHVDVLPPSVSAVADTQTQFLAVGKDLYGNVVSGLTFNWSTTVGNITQTGLFTALTPPPLTGFVNATAMNVTGSAVINIILNTVSRIVINPSNVNITAGGTQNFSATAYDVLGNLVGSVTFDWSTNLGTMTGSNLTAQTISGVTGYVRASISLVLAYAFVTVVPGALSQISLTPPTLSGTVGAQTQFAATGRDVFGNVITGLTFAWTSTIGSVSASGLFTAPPSSASGFVNASSGLIVGSAAVTIANGQLARIVVSPGTASVAAGAMFPFSATGYDQLGNPLTGISFTWSTNLGMMMGTSLMAQTTSGAVGYVNATSGAVTGSAIVSVVPAPLSQITLSPTSVSIVAGTQIQFTATGYDAYSNAIGGLTFAWAATVGGVSALGMYTAPTVSGSSGFVNASVGLVTGSASVSVVPDQLNHIVVTPSGMSVVAGSNQTFAATGYDRFNNVVAGQTYSWSTNIGTMSTSVLTAQNVSGASGYVMAMNGTTIGFTWATVVPGALDHIDVTPTPANVVAGSQAQFAASGKDVHNNVISGLTFSWSSNVGPISASGLLSAQTTSGVAGYVNATAGAVTGSAAVTLVTVNSPPVVFPVANVTATMAVPTSFTGLAIDVDNDPLRYTWNFGDGIPLAVGQTTSHIYAKPGIFTYTVYVDDLTGIVGHNVSRSAVATVPFVLHLVAGWNLISVPVQGVVPYKASTLGLSTSDEVFGWNSATQTYDKIFIVGVSPLVFDFELQTNQGYWIFAHGPRTVSFVGTLPTVAQSFSFTVPATGGLVLVGLASMNTGWTASTLASMISGTTTTVVSEWNPVTQAFVIYIIGTPFVPFTLAPGQGYFVFVLGSGTVAYTP